MKRGMKVLFALAVVLAVAGSPTWASCPFGSAIAQGGAGGLPPTFITGATGSVGGLWWEVGHGDPVVGPGNDSGLTELLAPAAIDAVWIDRALIGTPVTPVIRWDWTSGGSDGCLSGGSATGQMAVYVFDSIFNYAVLAVTGTAAGLGGHDFDNTGQNAALEAPLLVPAMNVNLALLTPTTAVVDVLPAIAAVNCFDDGVPGPVSGVPPCQDAGIIDTGTELRADSTAGPQIGCFGDGAGDALGTPSGGCSNLLVDRGRNYCWDTPAQPTGAPGSVGPSVCSIAPLACVTDADCIAFTLGVCLPGAVVPGLPMGPPINPGCIFIESALLSNKAIDAVAGNAKGFMKFQWDVNEFDVSHMQVLGTSRGERVLGDPIFARANDGSLQSYEALIPRGQVRFDRSFTIRVIANDGTEKDTPVTVE